MNTQPTHLTFLTLLRMTRPGFLVITVVACVLGMACALAGGAEPNLYKALATVLLATMAHAAANVLNDYHDALNGADAANTQGMFPFSGGSRMIQNGTVDLHTTRQVAWSLLGLVTLGGSGLVLYSGEGLLIIGMAGLVLGWAYSATPLQLMSRGLGELAVAVVWGLMVLGADYVLRGHFAAAPAITAVGYGLLIANILLVNGFPDAASDAQVGKRTLVVLLGPQRAALLYTGLVLLAHGWLLASVWWLKAQVVLLWGLASLPLALAAAVFLLRQAHAPQRLRPAIVLTIAAAVVHGLAMAKGLLLG